MSLIIIINIHRLANQSSTNERAAAMRMGEETHPEETYDFVEKPSENFFCPILSCLLLQPHRTECCHNHLSEAAANRIKGDNNPCPFCKRLEFRSAMDNSVLCQVRELKVFCPNRNRGCGWVEELSGLKEHSECCPKRNSPLTGHQVPSGNHSFFNHPCSIIIIYMPFSYNLFLSLISGYEVLNMDNAAIVAEELFHVRPDTYELGLALQLSQDVLQTIMTENQKPHGQILRITEVFLKRKDPKPTWRAIIEALKTPAVNRSKMAQQIQEKYCRVADESDICFTGILYKVITSKCIIM